MPGGDIRVQDSGRKDRDDRLAIGGAVPGTEQPRPHTDLRIGTLHHVGLVGAPQIQPVEFGQWHRVGRGR